MKKFEIRWPVESWSEIYDEYNLSCSKKTARSLTNTGDYPRGEVVRVQIWELDDNKNRINELADEDFEHTFGS
jgi:hypothetical protein